MSSDLPIAPGRAHSDKPLMDVPSCRGSLLRIVQFLVFGTSIAFPSAASYAMTVVDVPYACPIDGTKFTNTEMASAFVNDRRLDLKRLGAIQEPPRLPVCPKDGFVVRDFTAGELDVLKTWVPSKEYQALWHSETPYFLLAKIYEKLGKDAYTVGETYLMASWEVEHEPDRYREYLLHSLDSLSRYLSERAAPDEHTPQASTSGPSIMTVTLLTGEVERRLGLFERAQKRFLSLRDSSDEKTEFIRNVIAFQLELIQSRDSGPHNLSEIKQPTDGGRSDPPKGDPTGDAPK